MNRIPGKPLGLLHRSRKWILFACVAAWAGALVATHVPARRMPLLRVGDKVLHVAGFFALGGLFWATLAAHRRGRLARAALVLAAMPLYAAVDELTQPWFRRSADVGDWLADVAGTVCALALAELAIALLNRFSQRGVQEPMRNR